MRGPAGSLAAALAALLSLGLAAPAAAGTTACSASSQCPEATPCCMGGTCGKGSMYCANGCNPMYSHAPDSCAPMPVCKDMSLSFKPSDFNNTDYFMPILIYNGTANSPFTLDNGFLGQGEHGVALQMTKGSQTKLSSTNYILYGTITAAIRHEARAGVVASFITMSDVDDEIDWEFTTADPTNTQTNVFGMQTNRQPKTLNQTAPWTVEDVHVYGIDWQPEELKWSIDGKVVRTISANASKGWYPQSPSRVQFSMWAGGNATEGEGVQAWAGGVIDWDTPEYTKQGYYSHELVNYTVQCNHAASSPTRRQDNNSVTSWVWSGKNYTGDKSTSHPGFSTSTAPLTRIADMDWGAGPGMAGYADSTNPQVKNKNSWDGSGDQVSDQVRAEATGKQPKKPMSTKKKIKIGIIVAIVVGSVIVVWAVLVCCCRAYWRRQKPASDAALPVSGGTAAGFSSASTRSGGDGSAKYVPLHDAGSELKLAPTMTPEYPPPRAYTPVQPQYGQAQRQMPGAPGLPPGQQAYGQYGGYGEPAYQYHPY